MPAVTASEIGTYARGRLCREKKSIVSCPLTVAR